VIESYRFGYILVDGKEYDKDVIISQKGVLCPWWREEGHRLCLNDLKSVLKEKPKLLLIGTGHDGCMRVADDVVFYCKKNGIELVIEKTGDAVKTYNKRHGKGVVAALHLTC